jgi:hypothetical protein
MRRVQRIIELLMYEISSIGSKVHGKAKSHREALRLLLGKTRVIPRFEAKQCVNGIHERSRPILRTQDGLCDLVITLPEMHL